MNTTTVKYKTNITSSTRGHRPCPHYDGSQVNPPGEPGSLKLRGRGGGPPPGEPNLSQPRGSPPPLPPRARVLLPSNSYCPSPSPPSSPSMAGVYPSRDKTSKVHPATPLHLPSSTSSPSPSPEMWVESPSPSLPPPPPPPGLSLSMPTLGLFGPQGLECWTGPAPKGQPWASRNCALGMYCPGCDKVHPPPPTGDDLLSLNTLLRRILPPPTL